MKLICTIVCAATLSVVSVGTPAAQTEVKSKVKVKDGKEVNVTGCVASASSGSGNGYILTNVADKKGAMHSYMLASDDDLSKHVGHRVQISGRVADRGDGKIEMETKIKTKVEHGDDKETHSKSTMKGDMPGMAFLSVKSLKMIAAVCP
jgi:hypothetical protein